ncbi:RNA-directed DNA polymerase [Lactococcus lactis subsp. lactis]|uniref:Abortive infection protein n=1 Tax=Lactococcus lactis subsp. lactis TaxID=1360 RepID=A0AAC9W8K7_LACLL|nr:RNA-directed DNA polymerase [Lactococcus lactis]ARE12920.1 RNA-directed DNA polymerase [Lactococcus lactis subsp. lactis]ARE15330.1 RNA-directed DNA polymerase [Lactococcus lactis subsp. lactis]
MESVFTELYDLIFDPVFLVRYGYYDITIKNKKMNTEKVEIENDYGKSDSFYFKVFNMESFSEYLRGHDLKNFFKYGKSISTEPVYFSIPKNINSRRQYKMPNLYSYMALNYYMCDQKKEFVDVFVSNKFSTSKFFNQLNFDYSTTQEISQTLLYGGVKKLYLDLSNFYHTLYTHSIPWMITGKAEAKKDRKNGFANTLDKLITSCQYDETHGIPTGNLLSRIIAELYMCHFDKRMENNNFIYTRYVDDVVFPFTLEAEKEDFLKEFSLICRENNLLVNDNKTRVDNFPFINKSSKSNIFSFFENLTLKNSDEKWIKEISNFIDYCINEESLGNKGAIKSIFPVIKNTFKNKKISSAKLNNIFSKKDIITDFNIFEKILDLSLKDSRLTNKFLTFFENMSSLGFSSISASEIVKKYFSVNSNSIGRKIDYYHKNHFNQELYQILLYAVEFEIDNLLTQEELLKLITSNTDDFSLVLVTILYLKNGSYKRNELLEKIDSLFIDTHVNYPSDTARMSEKFWLFRYFFYFLLSKENINKKEVNTYCKSKNYNIGKNGYESELNWRYIRGSASNTSVNDFFNELIENEVWLIYCGENGDFKYLPR